MNEIESGLRPLLEALIADIVGPFEDDLKLFSEKITKDFATFLYRACAEGDEVAEDHLRDLRASVEVLAGIHVVRIPRTVIHTLSEILSVVAQIALKALKINLPTP